MNDDRLTNNDIDTTDTDATRDREPATSHDVTEGGVIGAVGGAIVGGLAGGPVGAVIGAVAGGVASAGAVDVVDKRDHDYNRTVNNDTNTYDNTVDNTTYDNTTTPDRVGVYDAPVTGTTAPVGSTTVPNPTSPVSMDEQRAAAPYGTATRTADADLDSELDDEDVADINRPLR